MAILFKNIQATLKSLFVLTTIPPDTPGTSRQTAARNGGGHNGHTTGTAAVPRATVTPLEASRAERDAYWKTQPHTTERERMQEWERRMDSWFAEMKADPALWAQYAFLQRLLGPQNGQPAAPVTVSAKAFYAAFMQGEGKGDIQYLARRIVATNTPTQVEQNRELIENLAKLYGDQTAKRALPLISGLIQTQDRHNGHAAPQPPSSVLGTDLATGQEVTVTQHQRQQMTYVTGVTGSGKSTMIANLIHQDLQQGLGICVIEPHGDLTKTVLSLVPQHRLKDVILLDVMDSDFPFSLNLFQCGNPTDMNEAAKAANFVMHVFEKVWHVGTETPRLQQVLRNITRTMIENPGMTFAEIPLLLWDDTVREKLVEQVRNTQTKLFWQQYNRKSHRDREELIASTMNKVDAYLSEPLIATIVSQSQSSIDFRTIMDESKILLVNLSPQLEEVSRMLGACIIGRLLLAAFSRADVPEHNRPQCNVYVDEFQRFATSDWQTFIAEARKFRVAMCAANQSLLAQLDESLRTAATGAGTLIVFRTTGEDADVLAKSYNATPEEVQIGVAPIRAPVTDVLGHLVRRGHINPIVGKFVSEYLMPLETLLKMVGHSDHFFEFGCTDFQASYAIQGRRLLNDALSEAMKTGRADIFLHPWALFTLGGAAERGITYVFFDHIKTSAFFGYEFHGFYDSANRFGRPGFLENKQAVDDLLTQHAKKRVWDDLFKSSIVTPGPSFIAMLRLLRQTMEVLAREPILVDTGQYAPVMRQRTYADQQHQIANELSQQADYTARVKTLTGEYKIRTLSAPPTLSEEQLTERIGEIKQRMRVLGYTKAATEVEQEVHDRQNKLRERPHSDAPPPSSTNGRPPRRLRQKPPPAFT